MEYISKVLRKKAIELGMCEKGKAIWKDDLSKDQLVEMMYRNGIDFCIKHSFPSISFVNENFNTEFLRCNGIFINERRSALNMQLSLVRGDSEITYRYNSRWMGNINACDSSRVNVIARNNSFVVLHLHGSAKADISQKDDSSVLVVRHSPATSVTKFGEVKIKDDF